MYSILVQWAKIAGIAGIAFGTLLLIYRAVISKLRSPDAKESGPILRLIVILTFVIGITGLLVYAAIIFFVPAAERSSYVVDSVTDIIDFSLWKPATAAPTQRESIVIRTRTLEIRGLTRTEQPFLDRNTTTGAGILAEFPNRDATLSEVTPTSGRTTHEYLLSLASETIRGGRYKLTYTLTYRDGWTRPNDNWVAKSIEYPTRNYHFVLQFPTPWTWVQVRVQPPGATEDYEKVTELNRDGALRYEWNSTPNQVLSPGTRILVYFKWPPLTEQSAANKSIL